MPEAPSSSLQAIQPTEAELPRYGIERVILIDSYLRGANTEIRLAGHTAITGANSAGKTSLIRLLPAFFGATPRALVKAKPGSTTKSFQDYYLPSKSSYVVFEYRTQRGLNLAVFITHRNTTNLKVVLISGGYADELFVGADERYLDKDGLVTRARAEGRIVKVCDTVRGYRQIVLGDAKVRGRTAEELGFNILVGYPNSTRRSLDGVHAVLTATLDEDVNERLLRKLLFEQAAQEANWSPDAELRFNADELEEWVGNYRGLKTMVAMTEKACDGIDAGSALRRLGVEEAVLKAAAGKAHERVVENLDEAQSTEQNAILELEAAEQSHNTARKDYERDHGEQNGKLRDVRGEKDSLTRRERELKEAGAEQAVVVAGELAERQTALGQARSVYEQLALQSAEIDGPINAAIERRKAEADTALKAVQQERQAVERTLQDDLEAMEDDQEEARQHLEGMLAEQGRELGDRERGAEIRLAELDVMRQRVEASPELVEQLEAARGSFDRVADGYARALATERDRQDALREARDEQGRWAAQLEALRRRRTELEAEQLKTSEILERKDTLLEFLREEIDGFEATIAATLSEGPELLYRKDLRPERATTPEDSFFGAKIDTSKLEAVDVDAETRARLREVERQLNTLGEEVGKAKVEHARAGRELKSAIAAHDQAHAESRQLASRREAMYAARERADREVREDRERMRATVESDMEAARETLEQAREAFAEHRRDAADQLEVLRNKQKSAKGARRDQAAEAREELNRKERKIGEVRDADIAEWEESRTKRRSEQGISDEELRRRQEGVGRARAAVEEAENARELAARWRTLREQMREQWPVLDRRERNALEAVARLETRWRNTREEFERQRERCEKTIGRARRTIARLANERDRLERLTEIETVLSTSGELDPETVAAKAASEVSTLEREAHDIRQGFKAQAAVLTRTLDTVISALNRTSSRLLRDFRQSTNLGQKASAISLDSQIEAADALAAFYGDPGHWRAGAKHFPTDTRGEELEDIVRSAIANRIELNGFLRGIDDIRASVARQRKGIEESFASFLESIDVIDSIEVNAHFDPNQVDGYQAAKQNLAALERYEQRRDASGDPLKLPDDDLVEAVEGLIDHLRARRAERKQSLEDAVQLKLAVTRLGGAERTESRFGAALVSSFSSGIGLMVVVAVLVGFMERLRRGYPVTIPWVLDEVLKLDTDNQRDLLRAMAKHHLFLTTTSPDIQDAIDPEFTSRYLLQREGKHSTSGSFILQEPKARGRDPFAAADETDDGDLANGVEHAAE